MKGKVSKIHRKTPMVTTTTHQLLAVPLEIWEQVAALTIPDPPLTPNQSRRLIRTLSLAKTSIRIPKLVWLIRSLSFAWDLKLWECQDGLGSLFEVSPSELTMRGTTLRSLEWNLPETHDQALALLLRPGCFPNLREITVNVNSVGDNASFDYLRIPGLEKLDCSWSFNDEHGPRTFNALGQALKLLQSSSGPSLNAYDDLIGTINQLRFPKLVLLRISIRCLSRYDHSPHPTDFGPSIFGNPSVREAVVDLDLGSPVRIAISSLAYTPLRAFTGPPEYCAAVSAHAPALERVCIVTTSGRTSPHHFSADLLFPPNVGPRVRHLTICGPPGTYARMDLDGRLSPQSLGWLVHAFPNTTHLDIRLDGSCKNSDYRDALVTLHALESLRMHRVVSVLEAYRSAPAAVVFPAEQYAAKINETLYPFLPQLRQVHMSLWN
ncbi:hypothetical protein DFH06DRAFT_1385182 [Mycena polygramma]|nr:hypothetical protein DFH06DRAFT_1385182 [Mycena polygramma]